MEDEVSLREIVEILKRHRRILVLVPLLTLALAVLYVFFIAKPVYESEAAFGVAPFEVRSQLESKIRVQYHLPISYASLKALALSQDLIEEVWQQLIKSGIAAKGWDIKEDHPPSAETLRHSLNLKDIGGDQEASRDTAQVVVEFSVRGLDPEAAAAAANLWADKVAERVNALSKERLEYALKNLGVQLAPAKEELERQEKVWQAFASTSRLEQDKKELDSRTKTWVNLNTERDELERNLADLQGKAQALEQQLKVQAEIVSPGASTLYLTLLNHSVNEAKKILAETLAESQRRYDASSKELEQFTRQVQLGAMHSRLEALRERLDKIYISRSSLDTSISALEASLRQVVGELEKTPEFLNLARELVIDQKSAKPLRALGLDQLKRLELKVESINPLYAPLFTRAVSIRADLDKLAAEKKALDKEYSDLKKKYDALNSEYASAKRKYSELVIRHQSDESLYKEYLKLYDRLPSSAPGEYRFRNENPEYARLVSRLTDVKVEQARSQARLAAVNKQIDLTQARIDELKGRVAKNQIKLNEISRGLKLARETYTALANERTDLKIELSGSQDIAQVLARAYPVYSPVAPKKLFTLVLALVLGLMLALAIALIKAALEPPAAGGTKA